jgi:hypothetical protein
LELIGKMSFSSRELSQKKAEFFGIFEKFSVFCEIFCKNLLKSLNNYYELFNFLTKRRVSKLKGL